MMTGEWCEQEEWGMMMKGAQTTERGSVVWAPGILFIYRDYDLWWLTSGMVNSLAYFLYLSVMLFINLYTYDNNNW